MSNPTKLEIALVRKLGGTVTLANDDFIAADRLKIVRVENPDGTVTLGAYAKNDARFAVIDGTCTEVKPKPPEPSRGRDIQETRSGQIECQDCGSWTSPLRPCSVCGSVEPDQYGGL